MNNKYNNLRGMRKGVALIVAMIFLAIFGALAVAMSSMSQTNVQAATNQQRAANALAGAQSGLEYAKYLVRSVTLASTNSNTVSDEQANTAWATLCTHIRNRVVSGTTVSGPVAFTDAGGTGQELTTSSVSFAANGEFSLRFYRYNNAPARVFVESTGIARGADTQIVATRNVRMSMSITKDARVLQYAIATRGRMWITGDSTIHGSVYSAWNLSNAQLRQLASLQGQLQQHLAAGTLTSTAFSNLVSSLSLSSADRTAIRNDLLSGALNPRDAAARCISLMTISTSNPLHSVSPFNMTGDSVILGSVNVCWTKDQVAARTWQLETWDEHGNPIYQTDSHGNILYVTDAAGNFLRDDNGNLIKARVISPADEIQGIFGDINYGVPPQNMAGMDIADYDTTAYRNAIPSVTVSVAGSHVANGIIATTGSGVTTVTEYFPHAAGSFTTPASSTSQMLTRRRYVNKTFTNVRIPANSNALFENCTFNGVLYIDTGQTGTSNFNNIRFHNCTFNGTIVTNTPQSFNWQRNALYFTGGSTFQNQTNTEATILAPHFNVNLGNTNPVAGTNNVLRGAIIGGIVDIRGNAEVFGTIISMADTSANTSGFVTNIGATLNDGGSETVAISDVGTINITPDAENRLPSGILTPIVIRPDQSTYAEVL